MVFSLELGLKAQSNNAIAPNFLEPIQQFIEIQQQQEATNLTHQIFQEIPHIDPETKQHFRRQIYLLIELYHNFYTAIEKYYSSNNQLLRRISMI
jgi:hypothetical protein